MKGEGVNWIAILTESAGDKAPVEGVGNAERKPMRDGEVTGLIVPLEFDRRAFRCLDHHPNVAVSYPTAQAC